MRTLRNALALALLLPVTVHAQPEERDLFQGVYRRNRVEVETRGGAVFRGTVLYIDASRSKIKIDVSLESELLDGAMTFDRKGLKRVTVLRDLSDEERNRFTEDRELRQRNVEAELSRIEKERAAAAKKEAAAAKAAAKAEAEPKAESEEAAPGGDGEKKDQERKEREAGLELLKKFPPKEGWGEERHQWLQIKFATVGAILTPDEDEFVAGYEAWKKAKAFADDQAKKSEESAAAKSESSEEKPAPEKTAPEKPAPEAPAPETPK